MQERFSTGIFCVKCGIYLCRCQHGRERHKATGQALGQAQEIRRDRRLFAGKQGAGTTETDRDLVGDQMHLELVAELAQPGEICRMVHAHAAGALHQRLDDHGADFRGVTLQRHAHVGEFAQRMRFPGFARLAFVAIGRGNEDWIAEQRRVGRAVQRHVGDRQRAQRFAVIAAGKSDKARLAVST